MDQKIKKFCTGCGLCQSLQKGQLQRNEKGFYFPKAGDNEWFQHVCPAAGNQMAYLDEQEIWGKYEAVYLGYSNDKLTRKHASSGGVLTEIATFLLESGKVDEIIHIGVDPEDQTKTKVYYSRSGAEVLKRCGSRYAISSPLAEIGQLDFSKKYAFIGKPCDVTALRNYMDIQPELKKSIKYLLSFFCMGLPSQQAQDKLLKTLQCTHSDCKSLTYRGNGWPGDTTAVDGQGRTHRMDYATAWGGILGRDVMPACKFCIDGIGEMSDISCGDAWYLTKDAKPDFSEHDGRNVVFVRTPEGAELISEIMDTGRITLSEYQNFRDELPLIQASQLKRRQDLRMRIMAMRFMCQTSPNYSLKKLKVYAADVPLKKQLRTFLGTCKRILKNSL